MIGGVVTLGHVTPTVFVRIVHHNLTPIEGCLVPLDRLRAWLSGPTHEWQWRRDADHRYDALTLEAAGLVVEERGGVLTPTRAGRRFLRGVEGCVARHSPRQTRRRPIENYAEGL